MAPRTGTDHHSSLSPCWTSRLEDCLPRFTLAWFLASHFFRFVTCPQTADWCPLACFGQAYAFVLFASPHPAAMASPRDKVIQSRWIVHWSSLDFSLVTRIITTLKVGILQKVGCGLLGAFEPRDGVFCSSLKVVLSSTLNYLVFLPKFAAGATR